MNADFDQKKNPVNPRDYVTQMTAPNLGIDRDILWSQESLRTTEKALDHKWTMAPPKK